MEKDNYDISSIDLIKNASEAKEVSYYFPCIVSIVGIGENLAARLIAELGDMTRLKSRRAIEAYAGLNPKIRQSGDVDGIHLAIEKKGTDTTDVFCTYVHRAITA
jgi:transposase